MCCQVANNTAVAEHISIGNIVIYYKSVTRMSSETGEILGTISE